MQAEIIAEYFNCIRSHVMKSVIACSPPANNRGHVGVTAAESPPRPPAFPPIYHQMSVGRHKAEIWWVEVIEDLIAWEGGGGKKKKGWIA